VEEANLQEDSEAGHAAVPSCEQHLSIAEIEITNFCVHEDHTEL
jgi:hypothetical protein